MSDDDTPSQPAGPFVPAPSRGRVALHIERIVLDGVALDNAELAVFSASIQTTLRELMENCGSGLATHANVLPALQAPAIQVMAPIRPVELGRKVAQSIHASLVRNL